ncbi:CPR5 protein [Artemisia annua]|uniref:CPR5 protein n=1 Tax=Artemisia annua TaxID=35608 RepID=A0A2U1M120_ARTAN|nr:CPR5 protein [Artemisia annua]
MTLRVISETLGNRERSYLHGEGSSTCNSSDFHFDMKENTSTGQEQPTIVNFDDGNKNPIYNEVAAHQDPINSQQLARVAPKRLHSGVNNRSMLTTFEKSVNKQAQGVKLSMGISKASFKANKFKTELQDSRHAQLLKSCLFYGTYIHFIKDSLKLQSHVCPPSSQVRGGCQHLCLPLVQGFKSVVSSSSYKPNAIWCIDDRCAYISAHSTFRNYKSNNANYFSTFVAGSRLRFCWKILHRYIRRKWEPLAVLLGVSLLGTFFRQRLYLNAVCYPTWACDSDWWVNGSYVIPVLGQAIGVLCHCVGVPAVAVG